MKKILFGFLRIIGVMTVLCIGAVIALDQYYLQNGVFPFGTVINGVYCTGMTAGEAASLLEAAYDLHADTVTVRTLDGRDHELPLDEYGVSISYQPAVSRRMERYAQHPFQWLADVFFPTSGEDLAVMYPSYDCDTAAMATKLEEADWLNENLYDTENTVSIVRSAAAGYILIDETRDLLLRDRAVEVICDKIVDQLTNTADCQFEESLIDLSAGTDRELCYQTIPYTAEMKDTLAKWKGISEFQDFHMTYLFGDREEIIDESVVADWMALDENGNILFDENNVPLLDETIIEEYVAYLSAAYNTVGIEREFHATRGDVVKVAGGSYGNKIDEQAQYEFLLNAFSDRESGTRIPQYTSEAWEKGADDIGDTYIEVDMGSQHMYYYADGEIVIDTPIVTGNIARKWNTPAKVCFVYFKQKNRVLRGANYATPVKYWMAVDGHIGIHDATWRKEFGGDIYMTNGSHGCINTPLEIMTELYDMVELGTPVIMFY